MMRNRFSASNPARPLETAESAQEDWTLTPAQMLFMLQHHNDIEFAFQDNDLDSLNALAETSEYLATFGDMSFDEAYDRYLTQLEAGSGAS